MKPVAISIIFYIMGSISFLIGSVIALMDYWSKQ